MRDIEFRGKRIDNGQWVYGCINIMQNGNTYIFHYSTQFAVIPETVGQCTGLLHDKNGKKGYEGDILEIKSLNYPQRVVFYDKECCFLLVSLKTGMHYGIDEGMNPCKIIGNIYDNPELLREE